MALCQPATRKRGGPRQTNRCGGEPVIAIRNRAQSLAIAGAENRLGVDDVLGGRASLAWYRMILEDVLVVVDGIMVYEKGEEEIGIVRIVE